MGELPDAKNQAKKAARDQECTYKVVLVPGLPYSTSHGSIECLFSTYFSRIQQNMEIAQNIFFLKEFLELCA